MSQKTLGNVVELMLAKKRTVNVDTVLKFALGNTEIGTLAVTGKIAYVPEEAERKNPE
ncbi:MAG TPA: hypothetical protein VLH35_04275 [Candidatus Acidoferrales bacterium]|nr:hypothetical protein [Candidatus Acidoferrales bacterium]